MSEGSWFSRLLAASDRLGWWTLPVFVAVGLAGAVLAGTLAVVWYGQQVDALEEETRASREEIAGKADEVREAGDQALEDIQEQVDAVEETLSRQLPIADAPAQGVVAVRAMVGGPPSSQPAPEQREPQPGGGSQPQAMGFVGAQEDPGQPTQQPTQQPTPQPTQQPTPEPTQQPTQPPPPPPEPEPDFPPREERVGSGFAVAVQDGVVFYATSFELLRDPSAPGGISDEVEVITPEGTFAAQVHSWDEGRNLALLRADAGNAEILEWRPGDQPIKAGARVVAAGVTPTLNTVQISGAVGFADITVLVTDLEPVGYLRGAPVVDGSGLVVGVFAPGYQPFGPEAGDRQAIPPVHILCERMLRNCERLEADPNEE